MSPTLTLIARLTHSATEARRGIVRIHPEALAALGLREWDGVSVIGGRITAAVVARATDPAAAPGIAYLDDVTLTNAGLTDGATVTLEPVTVYGARQIRVVGSALTTDALDPDTLRLALLGKVVTTADAVSLLPRDLGPGTSTTTAAQTLARRVGVTWTNELLTVVGTDPAGPVSVQPNTAVLWATSADSIPLRPTPLGPTSLGPSPLGPTSTVTVIDGSPAASGQTFAAPRPIETLVGVQTQARRLGEWLTVTLDEPELLARLGATARLGVLVSGPAGVGKATMVRSVAAGRPLIELDGPRTGSLADGERLAALADAIAGVPEHGILLIRDIDALLPRGTDAAPAPVNALILDALREFLRGARALVATSGTPSALDPRLRDPDLIDRELAIALPDKRNRQELLRLLLTDIPQGELDLDEIAGRTPGFVAADLASLIREAALHAATTIESATEPAIRQENLVAALSVIRPLSRSGVEEVAVGRISLDDVGNMTSTKQALTETVLWPLQHPDTFERLGVQPPRGVLLYGPPGCGKTFLVRALAGSGQLSVHSVKGSELLDKWVGASEKAVRELFERARGSAPSLIFLDEIDALASRRGQSSDSGVNDRVVAALLTELDGAEPLRDVVVVGATNRPDLIDPALLRPGRLERLIYVPPPDAESRAAILLTAARGVPVADDIDLTALAAELENFSAADCAALLRESALAAMRRSLDATAVTAADIAEARERVRPSLEPEQVAYLAEYSAGR